MKPADVIEINCTVNDAPRTLRAFPMERLLDVLRQQLQLTGTKGVAEKVSVVPVRYSLTVRS